MNWKKKNKSGIFKKEQTEVIQDQNDIFDNPSFGNEPDFDVEKELYECDWVCKENAKENKGVEESPSVAGI